MTGSGREMRHRTRLRCTLEHEGRRLSGSTQNVSLGGLRVELADPGRVVLRPGTRVAVELELSGDARPLAASCEIAWSESNDKRGERPLTLGLHFIDATPVLRERLQTFLGAFRYVVVAVDDEPLNLEMVRRTLDREFRVVACTNAEEALRVLEREEVAALICDQLMPNMSGLELVKRIEERWPLAPLQKIILTAHSNFGELQEFVNRGRIFHYFTKPFDIDDMLSAVRRAVERYTMLAENERLQAELERANRSLQKENAALPGASPRCPSRWSVRAPRCVACSTRSSRWRRATSRCSLEARPARARSSWRARCTSCRYVSTSRSSR
jgi:CheY-like chemotaxis protein